MLKLHIYPYLSETYSFGPCDLNEVVISINTISRSVMRRTIRPWKQFLILRDLSATVHILAGVFAAVILATAI